MSHLRHGVALPALLAASTLAGTTPAQYLAYGQGCPGASGLPTLTARGAPVLGQSFAIDLNGASAQAPAVLLLGLSSTSWRGLPLPFSLAAFGAPGCSILASGEFQVGTVTSAAGAASVPLQIPDDPVLAGTQFFNQWVAADSVNALGAAVTNGGQATILWPPLAIVSLAPLTVQAGTTLAILGQGFRASSGNDGFSVRVNLANGDSGLWRVLSVQTGSGLDTMAARLTTLPELPGLGPLTIIRGAGLRPSIAATPALGAPAEVWVWEGDSRAGNSATGATPITVLQGGGGLGTSYARYGLLGANLQADLGAQPCGLPGGYPLATLLTSDIRWQTQTQGEAFVRYHDVLVRGVAVLLLAGAPCPQVAIEHAAQIQAAVDAKYGPGRFTVAADTSAGRCRIVLGSAVPACTIVAGSGATVVVCP